jgi:hypothetical protein
MSVGLEVSSKIPAKDRAAIVIGTAKQLSKHSYRPPAGFEGDLFHSANLSFRVAFCNIDEQLPAAGRFIRYDLILRNY